MKCPFCEHKETQVLESRTLDEGDTVRRRRKCAKCGKRFTTYEKLKGSAIWVVKKDGKRELFDREKLRRGILRSLHKRPVSLGLVDKAVDGVEKELLGMEEEEVSSRTIGREVLRRLKKIDKVAWIRFASVYLEFDKLSDFEKAIDEK